MSPTLKQKQLQRIENIDIRKMKYFKNLWKLSN
jgi:hypothetical protein